MIKLPKTIKWIITDFDGVVTDNCVYIDEKGEMSRKLNFMDIMAFPMLKRADFHIGIISGEKNKAIDMIAERFKVDEVHQNIRVKIDVLKSIIEKYGLSEEEYLYIGDDINDKACLEFAKYKITVPHSVQKIKEVEGIQVTENKAGSGAFREVADCLVG